MTNNLTINGKFTTQSITGVQRYAFEITRRLPNSVEMITPHIVTAEYETLSNIATVDTLGKLVKGGMSSHLWEQFALPRWIKNNLLWSPCGAGPLAVSNQVLTIHDIAHLEHPEWFSRKFAGWYRFLVPRLVQRVQQVITVSEYTKERLMEITGIPEDKVTVIYEGVDERFQERSQKEIRKMKKDIGLPTENYVLTLASLEPRKNLDRLLKAWSKIEGRLPDNLWLVVTGAKGKSAVFQETSFENVLDRVHFTGYVSDKHLPALYSGAQIFIYPSMYEGFGLPPLESMACGTPVVASNTTSIPEVVGDGAMQIDPYGVDSIAHGIRRLVGNKDLRKDLIQRGLERAKTFSWNHTAERTWKTLKEAKDN